MSAIIFTFIPVLSRLDTATITELKRIAQAHLRAEDFATFQRVTGTTVAALLDDPVWRTTPAHIMRKIMGINKVVAHPLNANGLHAFRALLSERIADHIRHSRGFSTDHPEYDRFMRDGILVFPDVQNISRTLDGLFSAQDSQVERLLRMVSGFQKLGADKFMDWEPHTHASLDPQYYMHVDTYHPSKCPRPRALHKLVRLRPCQSPHTPLARGSTVHSQPGRSLSFRKRISARALCTMFTVPTGQATRANCVGSTTVREAC